MGTLLAIPSKEDIEQLPARERMVLLHQLIQAERELTAGFVDVLDVMDTAGDHRPDGHRSVRNLLVAHANIDHPSARQRVNVMHAMRLLPDVRARLATGEIGVAQVNSLADAYRNPRVRDHLATVEDQIIDWADWPHDDFDRCLRDFVRLADADGAEQRDNARHERRSLHHSQTGDGYVGNYGCGNAQGAVIAKVIDHFTDKEWQADWAEAKARVGDGVSKHDLTRTNEQRRVDALQAMCLAAASATPGLRPPEPLVNLMMDPRTLDETIVWATTGVRPPLDLTDIASRRCHTTDGVPIPPADALAAMLQGHVRRVVVDQGVTIDMGRRHRLFTGNARDAVMFRSTRCIWTGCNIPASNCEANHIEPWVEGGATNADQGAPGCDHHNRWKTRGFTTQVDQSGHWRTHRLDGTNVNAPPAA